MKVRKLLFLSYGVKGIIVSFCCLLIGVHYYLRAKSLYDPKSKRWVSYAKQDPMVNSYTYGLTKLMHAADELDYTKVIDILRKGADPNSLSQDKDPQKGVKRGMTPLHFVCIAQGTAEKKVPIVEALLANGADPNIKENVYGYAPIHFLPGNNADIKLCAAIISLLIQYGGDINEQADNGNTVLHSAVESNAILAWMPMVREKFSALVDLSIKNDRGMDVYAYARFLGQVDTANPENAKLFTREFKQLGPNERNSMGYTGLMLAAIQANVRYASQLLAQGASVSATTQDATQQTALHLACIHQELAIVKLLVQNGAKINKKNGLGNTALHAAVMGHNLNKQKKVFAYLMKQKGASINAQNNRGNTPVHFAVVEHEDAFIDLARDLGYTKIEKKLNKARASKQR